MTSGRSWSPDPEPRSSATAAEPTTPDAICCALRRVADLLEPAATVALASAGLPFGQQGSTKLLHVARRGVTVGRWPLRI